MLLADQLNELSNHPSIGHTTITFSKELKTHVSVGSTLDADCNTVDKLVKAIFPDMTYLKKPYISSGEGKIFEMYTLEGNDVAIYIQMIKTEETK